MAIQPPSLRDLLSAGVHFGHRTSNRNPLMDPYIYGVHQSLNLIDLDQTRRSMTEALAFVEKLAYNRGRILFVGTKRVAQDAMALAAQQCGMPYINKRWLGGTLTNFRTIKRSVDHLHRLDTMLADTDALAHLTKRERLGLFRERDKLEMNLGGLKGMASLPDALFIVGVNEERIAVREANRLGIPVIGVLDTNVDPVGVAYPIPGNDDSRKSVQLYADTLVAAILQGRQRYSDEGGSLREAHPEPAVTVKKSKPAATQGAGPKSKQAGKDAGSNQTDKPVVKRKVVRKAAVKPAETSTSTSKADDNDEAKPAVKKPAAKATTKAPKKTAATTKKTDSASASKPKARTTTAKKTTVTEDKPTKKPAKKPATKTAAKAAASSTKTDGKQDDAPASE